MNNHSETHVIISAQEKGKVLITGESCLRISGEYLEISGFVFTGGYTPSADVISFREKDGVYGNNCRLSECVIDGFNNPERFVTEAWVSLYGKNNRVDHCSFIDKRSQGVTMVVHPVDEACRNNNHRIGHNYFGYRQNLGSNGGETMRLGTSPYSLTTSGTIVEANYFDRCNGELEIISNKSCGNIFKDNTFFECAGTLTFRHGNDNLATGNIFLGNGKENTDGEINVQDRGDWGTGHGWAGANQVLWNCKASRVAVQSPWVSAKNYCIGLTGSKYAGRFTDRPDGYWEGQNQSGLVTESLYDAQVNDRLLTAVDPSETSSNSVSIFPNPSEGKINIWYSQNKLKYNILNYSGKVIMSGNSSQNPLTLDLTGYKNGLYLFEYFNGDRRTVQKVIIQK